VFCLIFGSVQCYLSKFGKILKSSNQVCLYYCSSLYCCITDYTTYHLQSIQNATTKLVAGTRRYEHIAPVLCQLHWLITIQKHVEFKSVTDSYTDTCPRRLHSADTRVFIVSWTKTDFSNNIFAAGYQRAWLFSYSEFRQSLKTLLGSVNWLEIPIITLAI